MTKFRLKIIFLRFIIGWYHWLGHSIRYGLSFLSWIGRGLSWCARLALPPIRGLYAIGFVLRRRVARITDPLRLVLIAVFGHRHVIHFAIAFIVSLTSVISLGNRVVHAEDLGKKSLLYTLVSGAGDDLIEEEAVFGLPTYPTEYLVDVVAVSDTTAVDFDFVNESYVSTVTGGSAIEVPYGSQAVPSAAPRTSLTTYVVKEGDTVSSIAEAHRISIETVLWANKLTIRSYIRPGDVLTILPLDGVFHTVKKGETLEKISKQYGADISEVLVWNKLSSDQALQIGESIIVPGGRPPTPPAPRRVSPPAALFAGPRPGGAAVDSGAKMLWPTDAHRITQYFGWRHTGVDIAGPSGTNIFAAEDGIVEYAGWTRGYGQNVVINHGNGIKTRYAHASKIYVKKGEQVKRGETIEVVGSTGRSTGPHLHFEVIKNGKFLNPFDFIR